MKIRKMRVDTPITKLEEDQHKMLKWLVMGSKLHKPTLRGRHQEHRHLEHLLVPHQRREMVILKESKLFSTKCSEAWVKQTQLTKPAKKG